MHVRRSSHAVLLGRPANAYFWVRSKDPATPAGDLPVAELILNSFPVEVSPTELDFPCIEYDTWDASTADLKQNYADFTIYRYSYRVPEQGIAESQPRIRMLLLSGPAPPSSKTFVTCNTGSLPHLTNKLIEHSLARNLEERGMTIKQRKTETLALKHLDSQESDSISFYTGISFKSRQPQRAEQFKFTLTVQWEVGATFTRTLSDDFLRHISPNMAVLYTPDKEPIHELENLINRSLGTVINTDHPRHALVFCNDNVQRSVPYEDLTLEPSPQALRRYDIEAASKHHWYSVHRHFQQLSKVLNRDGWRNKSVFTERLHEIIRTLSGDASDQLVLSLRAFAPGTVRIRLAPQRVWLSP